VKMVEAARKWGYLILGVTLLAPLARSQNANTGEMKGAVTDPSGASVPDVAISVRNLQTSVVTSTTTNQAGLYDVPLLAPGNYTIKFSKSGFRDFVREGIILHIETLEISATLQVGTASAEVVVNAAPPLIETETSDQHVDLDTEAIANAPITGTDWRGEMTQLIPGVNPGLYNGSQAGGQGVGINGTQSYNMNFMIDGSAATAPRDYNSSNFYMPLDSIDEVSINSSNAPAQYGNGLAAINVITRNGTNTWHGDLFEYVQNTAFNARSVFNPAPGAKSVEHWNEYGGSVSGPVLKDKLFFFFTYQRNPSATPSTGTYSYPTAAMQAGDFYGLQGSTGPAFNSTGILQGTYSQVAMNMQKFFPATNARGWISGCPGPANPGPTVAQTCPATNNYVFNGTSQNKATWYTGRTDYNISHAQKLSFTFNYFPTVASFVPPDPLFPNDASAFSQGNNYNLTGQLSHVYTISPRVLNEFRIGEARELDKYKPWSFGKNDPTNLGLEPVYGTNVPQNANVFPHITIDSHADQGAMALGAGSGNGNIDAVLGEGTFNTSDVLTLIHGRHTLKFGGEYDRLYQNYTSWGDLDAGHFEFNGTVTGVPYADFLAGDVYSWHVGETVATSIHSWGSALFAHDDFKISPKVTVNLGLRWQMVSGWGVKDNLFGIYDPLLPNSWNGGKYPGAILFGGQSDKAYGVNNLSTIENGDYKEFAPRVGVAWAFRSNWSFRASYGIFDAPRDADIYGGGNGGTLGLGLNPTSAYLGFKTGSSAFPLDSGPPAGSVQYPTLQTASSTIGNGTYIAYYPRSIPTTYIQEFLVSVQHQLPGAILLDTSYVYTRGTNLNYTTNIDAVTANNLGCSGGWWVCNPNPNFPYIAGLIFDGWSNYNALQLRIQKRMSRGLQFQANYAFSKSLDTGTSRGWGSGGVETYQNPYSPASNYAPSAFDLRHILVGQVLYELPFGAGRQHALHGVLDEIAGGWRVSTIAQWHSGLPFTPSVSSAGRNTIDPGLNTCWSCTLYAVRVGDPYAGGGHNTPGQWFNPAAYALPAPGTFGQNLRDSLYGPHFFNMDFGIGKTFSIRERLKFEFRADAYNVLNHIDYGNPNSSIDSSTAGMIIGTDVANSPRVWQLGGKLSF
jgi:Carboxypeptidase regulatory-like domain/TonB-dependent Receptor Plug Domain/TonB dependent receptor